MAAAGLDQPLDGAIAKAWSEIAGRLGLKLSSSLTEPGAVTRGEFVRSLWKQASTDF